ncbi:MAG: mannitol dehydrogenase family protein [Candidatus Puniceispirillaceae bacterium]
MEGILQTQIAATGFDRDQLETGIVHLGFGAFHRAHQAVYIDDYIEKTKDMRWGIAAVNLRRSERDIFQETAKEIMHFGGYFMKSVSADNVSDYRMVRPHIHFADWSDDKALAESLIAKDSVKLVTVTVTESGYYCDPHGNLDVDHHVIASEIAGQGKQSVYAYLRGGLAMRRSEIGSPLTIACCDNIRQNGKMLERNLLAYLGACGEDELAEWVSAHVAFPCSMVDRITPRSPDILAQEFSDMLHQRIVSPVMCEDYLQWVIAKQAANDMPDLAQVGVTVTEDVDPFEETKIRVLNGGHTALTYLAALEGLNTFDEAMRLPYLREHFDQFEQKEVLPAITANVPFSLDTYQEMTARRFGNQAIGDTVARICADGMAKFPIFIGPTLAGCFAKGIIPHYTLKSIASWYVFARHVAAGRVAFDYVEPGWDKLADMLENDTFFESEQLWGSIPVDYPEFIELLKQNIAELEERWPV